MTMYTHGMAMSDHDLSTQNHGTSVFSPRCVMLRCLVQLHNRAMAAMAMPWHMLLQCDGNAMWRDS